MSTSFWIRTDGEAERSAEVVKVSDTAWPGGVVVEPLDGGWFRIPWGEVAFLWSGGGDRQRVHTIGLRTRSVFGALCEATDAEPPRDDGVGAPNGAVGPAVVSGESEGAVGRLS